jgi:hypothetical protein
VVKTSSIEPLPKEGCSILDHSIMSYLHMIALLSLGGVLGEIRFPRE